MAAPYLLPLGGVATVWLYQLVALFLVSPGTPAPRSAMESPSHSKQPGVKKSWSPIAWRPMAQCDPTLRNFIQDAVTQKGFVFS